MRLAPPRDCARPVSPQTREFAARLSPGDHLRRPRSALGCSAPHSRADCRTRLYGRADHHRRSLIAYSARRHVGNSVDNDGQTSALTVNCSEFIALYLELSITRYK
jgi:hypothetical protein